MKIYRIFKFLFLSFFYYFISFIALYLFTENANLNCDFKIAMYLLGSIRVSLGERIASSSYAALKYIGKEIEKYDAFRFYWPVWKCL